MDLQTRRLPDRPERVVKVNWEPVNEIFNTHIVESFLHVLGEVGDMGSEWAMFRVSMTNNTEKDFWLV